MRPGRTFALILLTVVAGPVLAAGEVVDVNSIYDLPDANFSDGVPDADLETEGRQITPRAAIQHLSLVKGGGDGGAAQITLGVDFDQAGDGESVLENTILFKKGKKAPNCNPNAVITSNGGSIENGASCFIVAADGNADLQETDPVLAKKAEDNGGPTRTVALSPESPGIDFANDGNCPPEDARGQTRVDVPKVGETICDCCAYEYAPEPPPEK